MVEPGNAASPVGASGAQGAPKVGVMEVKQVTVRFAQLMARVDNLSPFASDQEVSALYFEFEILCQTQDGQVLKLKGSGLIEQDAVKDALQKGMDLRLKIAQKLIQRLQQIKDPGQRVKAAKILAGTLIGADKTIAAAGLNGKEELASLAEALIEECQRLKIGLGPGLLGQLAKIAAADDKPWESASLTGQETGLPLSNRDSGPSVWDILLEAEKEEAQLAEAAEEKRQAELRWERRVEERKLNEKIARRKRERMIYYLTLASHGAAQKVVVAANPEEAKMARQEQETLLSELDRLKKQEQSPTA